MSTHLDLVADAQSGECHPIVALADMQPDQQADLFALLADKQQLATRDGKPFFRVTFRDAHREVTFPIWIDSAWGASCRDEWTPGVIYKLRATYQETKYGPQLEIHKIRPATDADADDANALDPRRFEPGPRRAPEEMLGALVALVDETCQEGPLRATLAHIIDAHRDALLNWPASQRRHHTYSGGFLEHTLGVATAALALARQYVAMFDDIEPALDIQLVLAGAILHDVGKLTELDRSEGVTTVTATGSLVGHVITGRDIFREAAAKCGLEGEKLLRLEHILLSHQGTPELGSPKQPMTPEALIVHHADALDAQLAMMHQTLREDTTPGPMTTHRNALGRAVYRGGE
jgi:3'-5' exoribonuclease